MIGCIGHEGAEPTAATGALTEEIREVRLPTGEGADSAAPLSDGRLSTMAARLEVECNAPELDPFERTRCRSELFGRMSGELAAADPAIARARRHGASDAELTPLFEARYSEARRRLLLDAVDEEERAEVEDVLRRASHERAEEAPEDREVDEMMLPPEVRADLERRMDTTMEHASVAEVVR